MSMFCEEATLAVMGTGLARLSAVTCHPIDSRACTKMDANVLANNVARDATGRSYF